MLDKYNRLVENSVHFIFYVKDYLNQSDKDQEFVKKLKIKDFDVSQVKLAQGFSI